MRSFEIREASAADAPGIRRLFGRVFGQQLPAEEWDWKFARNPDGWFGVVAESDGRIVGNYAGWATLVMIGGRPRLAYAVGDVATDPDVRAVGGLRGIYRAMVETFYDRAQEQGVAFCFGFPNARALEISNRIAHTRTIFPIREVRIPCGSFAAPPEDIVAGDSVGEGFDALWAAAVHQRPDGPVRDRCRVNWRFHARPSRYYRMVSVGPPDAPESWAALSVVGATAVVADYVGRAPDGSDLPRMLAACAAEAARLGARELLFWESPGSPLRPFLERLPGQRRDAGFSLAARAMEEETARGFFARCHLPPSLYDVT